jgi:hypothetical protein
MTLTRLHYRRLRHYWQGKGLPGGGASLADGIDLDLAAAGLIVRRDSRGGAYFVTTPAGEQELHAERTSLWAKFQHLFSGPDQPR